MTSWDKQAHPSSCRKSLTICFVFGEIWGGLWLRLGGRCSWSGALLCGCRKEREAKDVNESYGRSKKDRSCFWCVCPLHHTCAGHTVASYALLAEWLPRLLGGLLRMQAYGLHSTLHPQALKFILEKQAPIVEA